MNRHIKFSGKVKRYSHNLSYRNFFSGEIGELRPVWLEDGVPGDTFMYKPELRLYFAPLVYPILSSMKARIDVFFVPNRLAWTEWDNFYTGGPDNSLSPSYPSIRNLYSSCIGGATETAVLNFFDTTAGDPRSIMCNLGHPSVTTYSHGDFLSDPYDCIPMYDYAFIWDEYYRDEEKQASITAPGGVRLDVYDLFQDYDAFTAFASRFGTGSIPHIAWSKDYFTTASLEQQRGGDIPLLSNPVFKAVDPLGIDSSNPYILVGGVNGTTVVGAEDPGSIFVSRAGQGYTALESVLTINGLRYLYAASAWLNNNVVGGTRHIEVLRSRYKVVSSDARLQRPELVGSISIPVNVDVVTQVSSTVSEESTVQALGDRAGKASVVGSGKMLTYSCEEFGYFIGILHVAPKAAYFQGIRRNLQREDKFDFYMPEFERCPQREIRNNEIFAGTSELSPEDGGIFGYTGMYNEYRHHNDEVHGDFQDTLLAWTQARKFSTCPSVNSDDFLLVDNDAEGNNRIFAVPSTTYSHIFGVVNNIVSAKREISNREPNF